MDTTPSIVGLTEPGVAGRRSVIGGKAAELARLSAAGFVVPPGFVVTARALSRPDLAGYLRTAADGLGAGRFAVRSSGVAEDLPDASHAGLYETYLDVSAAELENAVRCCFAAAKDPRVAAYQRQRGIAAGTMAVLVQAMIHPAAAGVAFTADPLTGDRTKTVITAVAGLGESLVSGEALGEEWTAVSGLPATRSRAGHDGTALTVGQADAVARLARRVCAATDGIPQDIEWAIDSDGRLWLLQARPMTALPSQLSWDPPGRGLWMRNFRIGEWLPEAVTPLFATWLLPLLEGGYLDGMHTTVGVRVPFRYALVNGWYYNAPPLPSPRLLAQVLLRGRSRAVKVLYHALYRVGKNPAAADRAVLSTLERDWQQVQLPRYRHQVARAAEEVDQACPRRLAELVNQLGTQAGVALWYLAILGGSAWKMEAALTRFARRHLATALPADDGGAQVLLRGLAGAAPRPTGHAVHSLDWYHPLAAGGPAVPPGRVAPPPRQAHLVDQRRAAERRARIALADRPALLTQFDGLLQVNQRYAIIREQQAQDFTLAWPVLRRCADRLGDDLVEAGVLADPGDIFFCTRQEVSAAIAGRPRGPIEAVPGRRQQWQQHRKLAAPLTLGRPGRLIGNPIAHAVHDARGATTPPPPGTIIGHPASAGIATGPVRIIDTPAEFAAFKDGEILVAKATTPAWTPLFATAAAVVTDGGSLAAHASLVAREYGIPAVVGTGNATTSLRTGQTVTVDGNAGTVTPRPADHT